MDDMLQSDAVRRSDEGTESTHDEARFGSVTYTIKVLSTEPGVDGRELSTVLFSRTSREESIELSAQTDTPNLLAKLPDLLDAALEIQRALWPAQRTVSRLPASFFPLLAEESRLVRSLTEHDAHASGPANNGVLRLIGMAYRALRTEAFLVVPDATAPPRARPHEAS